MDNEMEIWKIYMSMAKVAIIWHSTEDETEKDACWRKAETLVQSLLDKGVDWDAFTRTCDEIAPKNTIEDSMPDDPYLRRVKELFHKNVGTDNKPVH